MGLISQPLYLMSELKMLENNPAFVLMAAQFIDAEVKPVIQDGYYPLRIDNWSSLHVTLRSNEGQSLERLAVNTALRPGNAVHKQTTSVSELIDLGDAPAGVSRVIDVVAQGNGCYISLTTSPDPTVKVDTGIYLTPGQSRRWNLGNAKFYMACISDPADGPSNLHISFDLY
jgi:hypothetical protein